MRRGSLQDTGFISFWSLLPFLISFPHSFVSTSFFVENSFSLSFSLFFLLSPPIFTTFLSSSTYPLHLTSSPTPSRNQKHTDSDSSRTRASCAQCCNAQCGGVVVGIGPLRGIVSGWNESVGVERVYGWEK